MDKPDLYDSQPDSAYMLWKPFDMPKSNGTVWAIAMSSDEAKFVNATLSVVYTLIFSWLWGLIAAAVIYFVPHGFTRRRLVALVALRNSSNPWSALQAFADFTLESMGCFRPKRHGQPSTFIDSLFGIVFAAICLIVVAGSITMGIIGPPLLQIGNVAPVTSSVLFYPRAGPASSPSAYRAFFGDPSIRALSSVEVFKDATWSDIVRVQEDPDIPRLGTAETPMYGLNYSYDITGVELGLKHSLDLTMSVKGGCRTEYGWLNEEKSQDNYNHYELFGDVNNIFKVNLTTPYLTSMPKTSFTLKAKPDAKAEAKQGNISYAVVTTMAHRKSATVGEDPWYQTELRPEEDSPQDPEDTSNYPFRIKSRRPALSCWYQDTWSCCGGETVTGVYRLQNMTRLRVPQVLRDVITSALLWPPMQRLGENSGMSALTSLISSLDAKDGIVDAESANIKQDMNRLFIAAYITTLNTLAYSTRFQPSDQEITRDNWFYDKDTNALKAGADDFVVTTPKVQTFSLSGLIAAASIAVVLLVLKLVLTIKIAFHGNVYANLPDTEDMDPHQKMNDSPINTDRWARYKAFSAVHLLRNIYEDGTGAPQKDWKCSEGLPEPRDRKPLELVRCSRGDYGCAGHLATAPELLELGLQGRKRRHTKVNSLSTLLGDGDSLYQQPDESSKKTSAEVTVTPFNGYSSSGSTPQQEDLWSPDVHTSYNSYFPQTQAGPYQANYHDDMPITSAPPLQQPTNFYSGSRR